LLDAIHFGPAACDAAVSEDKLIDVTHPKSWNDVVTEASESVNPLIPPQMLARPSLTLPIACLCLSEWIAM